MLNIIHGDCRNILPTLTDSFDACITDPPYELSFMGRAWDATGVTNDPDTWRAVYRVLKPGAHLVAFGGSRTHHRMVCAIEDAGFEIRDTLMWIYGSGFPKSLDVSKAIDKAAGVERPIIGNAAETSGRTIGCGTSAGYHGDIVSGHCRDITAPATPEAQQWAGWGTALKPAYEPIILARKPLAESTVAANVLLHGTGAINIDACRVGTDDVLSGSGTAPLRYGGTNHRPFHDNAEARGCNQHASGRWPANVIHDGSYEVEAAFAAFGERANGYRANPSRTSEASRNTYGAYTEGYLHGERGHNDTGTASRFFYSAKATKADRADSKHPTVKPVALMRWLCRLVTPPGGHIIDPFAGSGAVGEAAMLEGFSATMIELEAQHAADIQHRIKRWSGQDAPLFAAAD